MGSNGKKKVDGVCIREFEESRQLSFGIDTSTLEIEGPFTLHSTANFGYGTDKNRTGAKK